LDTVYLGTIASTGIDMGYDLGTIFAIGIEIGVEDAGAAAELKLAARHLDHIKARLAKQTDERRHILAHHRFKAL